MDELFRAVQESFVLKIIVGVVSTVLLTGLAFLFKPFRRWASRQWSRVRAFVRAGSRLDKVIQSVEGDGVWKSDPPELPRNYDTFFLEGRPILLVANLKGGVGKTTIAANLAAFFSEEMNEKVLLIDLDFQGSLSSMLLPSQHRLPAQGMNSKAAQLVEGKFDARDLLNVAHPINGFKNGDAIAAYYDVARSENRVMIHWLAKHTNVDVRYSLAEVLHDPKIWNVYKRVIIDAPPRMTTATVQALCASSHVLIPTILDGLSGEAVASFIDQIESHRSLWKRIKYVGICASMTARNVGRHLEQNEGADPQDALFVGERDGLTAIRDAVGRVSIAHGKAQPLTAMLPPDTFIAKKQSIAQSAGTTVAFLDLGDEDRDMFRRLGREVARRMAQ